MQALRMTLHHIIQLHVSHELLTFVGILSQVLEWHHTLGGEEDG